MRVIDFGEMPIIVYVFHLGYINRQNLLYSHANFRDMALILSLETSTSVCSASIARDGKLIAEKVSYENKSHAILLTVFVEQLLNENGIKATELDAVAVSQGPGSYTGLRIGVSTAKGLCYALGAKLLAVDTLKAMAVMASKKAVARPDLFCSMIDARRMEVYTALYDADLNKVDNTRALVVDADSFAELLKDKKIAFYGDGAGKCRQVIDSPNAIFIDDVCPLASNMVQLAEEAYANADFKDVAYFDPFYLKDFVATVAKNKVL